MSSFYPDRRTITHFRFALIDATYREELPSSWPTTVVAPSFLEDDTDRSPALVDLPALPDDERAEWCDHLHHEVMSVRDTRASLLLATESSATSLAAHLARRMVIRVPGQDHPLQWRFFDPGTCLQMPRLLGPTGLAWLMGPVKDIMVPWAGEWSRIEQPQDVSPEAVHDFKLSQEHIAALLRLAAVNRAAMACPAPANAQAWTDQCAALNQHVLKAQTQYGLNMRDDLVAFALHAHTLHPDIHRHPHLQPLLLAAREAKPEDATGYQELTGTLLPEDWQRMLCDIQNIEPQDTLSP